MMALSSCVSSVSGDLQTIATAKPTVEAVAQANAARSADGQPITADQQQSADPNGSYTDPAVATASSQPQDDANPQMMTAATGEKPANIGGLAMQPTGINANRASIYAVQAQPGGDTGAADDAALAPAYVPVPGVNPAFSSVYSAAQQTPAGNADDTQPSPDDLSGKAAPADGDKAQAGEQTSATTMSDESTDPAALAAQTPATDEKPKKKEAWTLASLFAGKRKNKAKLDEPNADDEKPDAGRKTIALNTVNAANRAYLGSDDLPGVKMEGFYSTTDLEQEDDAPAGLMKLASLSGMTRIAPNGLTLQTENVDVGCFKPSLVHMIKSIEQHYGRNAIVTSGYRDVRHNRRAGGAFGSLHTSCEAADIQIQGVSKWELAQYLRSRPDRGGVGTYCHTESVHVDTGEARDWNWRCRRLKRK